MKKDKNDSEANINRRRFMMAGAGAVAGTVAGTMALPEKAEASHGWSRRRTSPEPKPIVGGIDPAAPGPTLPPPYDFIHWYASGPVDTLTPFTGIPLFGLDYDPLTIGDFTGHVAYAYLDGKAKGSDGEMYDMEVDLRVYDGKYVDRDGEVNYATFALI